MCFALVNSTWVFQKGLYYKGFCWLCMRNSLADDVNLILIEFRNAQQYSNRKYSTCTFRTLDIKCYFVYICLICLIYICLISNYSNSVLLLRILLLQIYPFIYCLIKKTKKLLIVYRKKSTAEDQVLKFQRASKSTFMLCCSYFYVVPLFFIFEICK